MIFIFLNWWSPVVVARCLEAAESDLVCRTKIYRIQISVHRMIRWISDPPKIRDSIFCCFRIQLCPIVCSVQQQSHRSAGKAALDHPKTFQVRNPSTEPRTASARTTFRRRPPRWGRPRRTPPEWNPPVGPIQLNIFAVPNWQHRKFGRGFDIRCRCIWHPNADCSSPNLLKYKI